MKTKILATTLATVAFATIANAATTSLTPADYPGAITATASDGSGNFFYKITSDISIPANDTVILEGTTFVDAGVELELGAGVIVRGQPEVAPLDPGSLFVTREGKINAVGTSTNPVIFTTAADSTGARYPGNGTFLDATPKTAPLALDKGLWGAVTLLGKAPTNTSDLDTGTPGEAFIEGITVSPAFEPCITYGGKNVWDNSGTLEFVSIRYSGKTVIDGDEQQGLTLGGVGAGTCLKNIEIFGSDDDGIEIFGGTAEVSNLALIGHDDDGFDGDHGWQGNAQFVLIVNSYGDYNSDHAIELDGDDTGDFAGDEDNISADGRPFASGCLTNFTIIGFDDTDATYPGGQDTAVRFRRGFGGSFTNSLITGFSDTDGLELDNNGGVLADGITNLPVIAGYGSIATADRVRDCSFIIAGTTWFDVGSDTAATVAEGSDPVEISVLTNNAGLTRGVDANFAVGAVSNLVGADPAFGQIGGGLFGTDNGGVELSDIRGSTFNPVPNPANSAGWGAPIEEGCQFEEVTYRGAFRPASATDLWTTGWTAINVSGILTSSN